MKKHDLENLKKRIQDQYGINHKGSDSEVFAEQVNLQLEYLEMSVSQVLLQDQIPQNLLELFLVHETYWMRSAKHMDVAIAATNKQHVAAWSVACSTGQEAYSLAMLGKEAGKLMNIYATDVSQNSIGVAKTGKYTIPQGERCNPEHTRGQEVLLKYLQRNEEEYCVVPEIQSSVYFKRQNALTGIRYKYEPYDIIICMNLMVYMDIQERKKLLDVMVSRLARDGILICDSGMALEDQFREKGFKRILDGEMPMCFRRE